jgi:uncharacterized protein (DUF1697 family)
VARYAALLRGVNVGGNRLAMADLRRLVERSGGRDAVTYLQSGNVVYSGPKRVARELEGALLAELGLRTSVLIRSAGELARVVAGKPFPADGKALSVTFLAGPADPEALAVIEPAAYGEDRFRAIGAEIYLYTPGGYGRTALNNTFWERTLATTATTRNWNTVVALAQMTG